MVTTGISRDETIELMKAVQVAGSLEHLRLTDWQFADFLAALAVFIGGPLGTADAFLTEVPDPDKAEHQVFWIRGNTIGALTVAAHGGPEGANEPAVVAGHIRHVSDIVKLEIKGAAFVYSQMGGHAPEVRPNVHIHLADQVITVDIAARKNEGARHQASAFIACLQDKLAALT